MARYSKDDGLLRLLNKRVKVWKKGGMPKKYRIHLSAEQRVELQNIVRAGKAAATKRQRAQILLAADAGHPDGELKDEDIARAVGVSVPTVERTRCALCEHGLTIAVQGWPAHRKTPRGKLDGWAEAHLVAATCSPPPRGGHFWRAASSACTDPLCPASRRCYRNWTKRLP